MNECLHSSLVAKLSKRSLVFLFQLQIFSAPYCPGSRPWHLKWYHQCIFSIKCILFSSLNIRTQSLIGNVSGWVSTFQSLSSLWWLSYILIIQEKKCRQEGCIHVLSAQISHMGPLNLHILYTACIIIYILRMKTQGQKLCNLPRNP